MKRLSMLTLAISISLSAPAFASPPSLVGGIKRKVGQFFADQQLRRVGSSLDGVVGAVGTWTYRGKPDALSTGSINTPLLSKVRDRVHRAGKRLGDPNTLAAFTTASEKARQGFLTKLSSVRRSLREVDGVGFIGGGMNDFFDAPSDKSYKAGIAGFNAFLDGAKLGHIDVSTSFQGEVGVSAFHLRSEAYRLSLGVK